MNIEIDGQRLVLDIRALAIELRAKKAILGAAWDRPMAAEQQALVRARRRATELCVLRAFSRGRFHVTKEPHDGACPAVAWDREAWHRRIAERVARDYSRAGTETVPEGGRAP